MINLSVGQAAAGRGTPARDQKMWPRRCLARAAAGAREAAGVGAAAAGLAAFALVKSASANGFSLPVQDALQVGRATAGVVAGAADASVAFHNPAAMTELDGEQVLAGATAVYAGYELSDRGSSATTPGTGGVPAALVGTHDDPRTFALVPTGFYARPLSQAFWLGLAITSPWGLGVEYDDDWFGRYDSIETRLTTINVSPVVAYRVLKWLSIGGGLNVEYADAKLTSALPDTFAAGGPSPATDGVSKLTGDDVALGFNVGVLITPLPGTRIGVHYRSAIDHDLSGKVRVRGLTGPLAPGNGRSDADTKLKLPDVVAIGIAQELFSDTTLFAEAQWFNWSRFEELRAEIDGAPDSVRPQDWEDTWSFYGGLEQRLFANWIVRAGAGYEPTPTTNAFRNTSLPDGDRIRLGLGVSYVWSDRLRVDLGYAHVFSEKENIDLTRTFYEGGPAEGSVTTRARADLFINDLALRVRYRF